MLSAGSLSGTGALTVNGMLTWMAGTMSGSGATVIPSGATLTVSGTDNYLAQRTINNAGDRKSTRLNSSHRCRSYAVFCLKKELATARPDVGTAVGARAGRRLGVGADQLQHARRRTRLRAREVAAGEVRGRADRLRRRRPV